MYRILVFAIRLFASFFLLAPTAVFPASEEDIDRPLILVAKQDAFDEGSSLHEAVIYVTPAPGGGHMGFMLNKPTHSTLSQLYPEHKPSKNVLGPIYRGGPIERGVLFALLKKSSVPGLIPLSRGLYLARTEKVLDAVIEKEGGEARYFAGGMAWKEGDFRAEVNRGGWHLLDATPELVFDRSPELWEKLLSRILRRYNSI